MKFYDMNGNTHSTNIGAMMCDVKIGVGDFFQQKIRRQKSPMQESKRFVGEFYPEEQNHTDESPVQNTTDTGDTCPTVTCSDNTGSDIPVAQNIVEAPPSTAPLQKINIDYAHKQIQLVDVHGNIVATSDLDERLVAGTIDKALLDVLYPSGNVPKEISMNVQSLDNSTDTTSSTGELAIIDTPSNDFPMG